MPFKLLREDGSIEQGLRRLASEQIHAALAQAASADKPFDEVVHDVRTRCKRLRGLIRLVRPAFPGYRRENAAIREAAGGLSFLRDADVLLATFDKVARQSQEDADTSVNRRVRDALVERVERIKREHERDRALVQFSGAFAGLEQRAENWQLRTENFAAIRGGLKEVYASMRRSMSKAQRTRSGVDFHEWRKQVKYHWHHLSLLREVAPHVFPSFRDLAGALGDKLGSHHDLFVLSATLSNSPREFGSPDELAGLQRAIARQKERLEGEMFRLGHELAAERPSAHVRRAEHYWSVWRQ